ncbi:hypothetical protein [Cognatitamlana onchidii]|uniref:hypothetical protein n=1 Tax=Cognatitamlana onchidii TaxID=2562860 RepID=UPI0010A5C83A|nr:hypothetical protein [Algibacter onchidii]
MSEKELIVDVINVLKTLEGKSLKRCQLILEDSLKSINNIAFNHELNINHELFEKYKEGEIIDD